MPQFSLTVETTSNATAGAANSNTAIQILAPATKQFRLIGVLIHQHATAAGENIGRWVIDRITAVGSGSALTPLLLSEDGAASAITDATKTISTTVAAGNTAEDAAIVDLQPGWNWFVGPGMPAVMSGIAKGFALRRATAPTGARIVVATLIWEE